MNQASINPYRQFIFQQDSARSHITIIRPGEWALSSPDLNPLEYLIWSIVEQLVYREHITNVQDLNKRAVQAWKKISQKTNNECISQFRPCYRKY